MSAVSSKLLSPKNLITGVARDSLNTDTYLFLIMCIGVHLGMCRSQRLDSSGVGVPGGSEQPDGGVWVLNRGPLEDQHMFQSVEPALQPPYTLKKKKKKTKNQ